MIEVKYYEEVREQQDAILKEASEKCGEAKSVAYLAATKEVEKLSALIEDYSRKYGAFVWKDGKVEERHVDSLENIFRDLFYGW